MAAIGAMAVRAKAAADAQKRPREEEECPRFHKNRQTVVGVLQFFQRICKELENEMVGVYGDDKKMKTRLVRTLLKLYARVEAENLNK